MSRKFIGVFSALISLLICAKAGTNEDDISAWLAREVPVAETYMMANISPRIPGYKKGFVIAAPWVVPGVQNYKYHWIRDAALVMNTIFTRYLYGEDSPHRRDYFEKIVDYLNFSKQNQLAIEPDDTERVGLGEVKFNPDGTRFTKWMRPQNDGPALRAITIIRFAHRLYFNGNISLAKHLFDGSSNGQADINASSVIKADLDYIASHWRDVSFDPWEEVKGRHFYTAMVQRKALLDGANLARVLGDAHSSQRYIKEAEGLRSAIDSHVRPNGQIWDTLDRIYGIDYKSTGLDTAGVLAALHAHNELDGKGDRYFSASDDRVLKTAFELSNAFQKEFPLSQSHPNNKVLGTPIGRYPNDKYNGYDSNHAGNPWYLTTAAFAELYYRCAREWIEDREIRVNNINIEFLSTLTDQQLNPGELISSSDRRFDLLVSAIRLLGDSYLRRIMTHAGPEWHFTEEYSRNDGSPTGAVDLSWSYASILSAAENRR